jgi:hypothetical protein
MRLKMGFSMEIPFLYPNCSGIKIPFTCKCIHNVNIIKYQAEVMLTPTLEVPFELHIKVTHLI